MSPSHRAAGQSVLAMLVAVAFPLTMLILLPAQHTANAHYAVTAVLLLTPVLLLRRRPWSLAVLTATGWAVVLMSHALWPMEHLKVLADGLALALVAATCSWRVAAALGVPTLVLQCTAVVFLYPSDTITPLTLVVLVSAAAWLTGRSVRERGEHREALREQAAVQAVTAERLRIARELHDMVAHSIGVIAIQAGVGGRVIDTQPAEARNALAAIEETSRETLAGLRRMLGALRQAEPGAPVAAPLEPVPGLADLDRLVASTGDAGVRVEVRREGTRRALPPEVDLSAFRIVQEAVTNVVRHARTDGCRVTLGYGDGELTIEVVDDGPGAGPGPGADPGGGFGIVGMRERAGLLHGRLDAGPRPEGGFRVAATLPVPAEAR